MSRSRFVRSRFGKISKIEDNPSTLRPFDKVVSMLFNKVNPSREAPPNFQHEGWIRMFHLVAVYLLVHIKDLEVLVRFSIFRLKNAVYQIS